MNVLFLTCLDKYRTVLSNILCSCKAGIVISIFSFYLGFKTAGFYEIFCNDKHLLKFI